MPFTDYTFEIIITAIVTLVVAFLDHRSKKSEKSSKEFIAEQQRNYGLTKKLKEKEAEDLERRLGDMLKQINKIEIDVVKRIVRCEERLKVVDDLTNSLNSINKSLENIVKLNTYSTSITHSLSRIVVDIGSAIVDSNTVDKTDADDIEKSIKDYEKMTHEAMNSVISQLHNNK